MKNIAICNYLLNLGNVKYMLCLDILQMKVMARGIDINSLIRIHVINHDLLAFILLLE